MASEHAHVMYKNAVGFKPALSAIMQIGAVISEYIANGVMRKFNTNTIKNMVANIIKGFVLPFKK